MWKKHGVSFTMIVVAIVFLCSHFFGLVEGNFNLSAGIVWGILAVVEFIIESKNQDKQN